jgi:hypothetical protein
MLERIKDNLFNTKRSNLRLIGGLFHTCSILNEKYPEIYYKDITIVFAKTKKLLGR